MTTSHLLVVLALIAVSVFTIIFAFATVVGMAAGREPLAAGELTACSVLLATGLTLWVSEWWD